MSKKIRVGVLFGGKSSEHEVSLQSARNVIDAIDKTKYEVVPIGIDKTGRWFLNEAEKLLPESNKVGLAEVKDQSSFVALVPEGRGELVRPSQLGSLGSVDVVFSICFTVSRSFWTRSSSRSARRASSIWSEK